MLSIGKCITTVCKWQTTQSTIDISRSFRDPYGFCKALFRFQNLYSKLDIEQVARKQAN